MQKLATFTVALLASAPALSLAQTLPDDAQSNTLFERSYPHTTYYSPDADHFVATTGNGFEHISLDGEKAGAFQLTDWAKFDYSRSDQTYDSANRTILALDGLEIYWIPLDPAASVQRHPNDLRIQQVAIHPADKQIYAATQGGNLFTFANTPAAWDLHTDATLPSLLADGESLIDLQPAATAGHLVALVRNKSDNERLLRIDVPNGVVTHSLQLEGKTFSTLTEIGSSQIALYTKARQGFDTIETIQIVGKSDLAPITTFTRKPERRQGSWTIRNLPADGAYLVTDSKKIYRPKGDALEPLFDTTSLYERALSINALQALGPDKLLLVTQGMDKDYNSHNHTLILNAKTFAIEKTL